MTTITKSLSESTKKTIPIIGLLTEYEPAYLLSTLTAFDMGRYDLVGYSLNPEMDIAQLVWKSQIQEDVLAEDLRPAIRKGIINYMKERSQPVEYSVLAAAAGFALATKHIYQAQIGEASDRYTTAHNTLKTELLTAGDYIRYRGQRTIETEIWWKKGIRVSENSTDDRIEMAVVEMLMQNQGAAFKDIQKWLNNQFPGMLAPGTELIRTILDSYGEITDPVTGIWKLTGRENPTTRQTDLSEILSTLECNRD